MIYFFLLSGLFLGWSLGANDAGNIFGAAVGTKMIKFRTAAIIASIFVIIGAVLNGSGASSTLNDLGSVNAIAGAFTVALAAALTITSMAKSGIPVSSSQAIVGSVIGWNVFTGSFTDPYIVFKIVIAWLFNPILAALIAFTLFYIFRFVLSRIKYHLLEIDYYNRVSFLVIGAFGAFSLGANNIANVMGVFVPSSPFNELIIMNHRVLDATQQLFLLGAFFVALGILTYSQRTMRTVGNDLFRLSPITGLIVVLSVSIIMFLFSSQSLQRLLLSMHLPTLPLVPVSSSQAAVGAIVGVAFAKGIRNLNYTTFTKIGLSWIINPIVAGVICLVSLFIVQNVFNQTVFVKTTYVFSGAVMKKLDTLKIPINRLSTVNGRTYYSSAELRNQLNLVNSITRQQKVIIAKNSEYYPTLFKAENYKKLPKELLDKEQMRTLYKLKNQSFNHKWQVADTLSSLSKEWSKKPKSWSNDVYNQEIDEKLAIINKYFH